MSLVQRAVWNRLHSRKCRVCKLGEREGSDAERMNMTWHFFLRIYDETKIRTGEEKKRRKERKKEKKEKEEEK